jgi:hypothetical protein
MKIRSERAELFHADGQTDTTNLVVAFRTFANAPNNANNMSNSFRQSLIIDLISANLGRLSHGKTGKQLDGSWKSLLITTHAFYTV